MSLQLYVRIPPRLTDATTLNINSQFLFILARTEKKLPTQIEQTGAAQLADLPKADEAILIFSGSDVTLQESLLPASLGGNKLKAALSNAMEDQLLTDVSTVHMAISPVDPKQMPPQARTMGAIDRLWFTQVLQLFSDRGYKVTRAVPEALCIPCNIRGGINYIVSELEDGTFSCSARMNPATGLGFNSSEETLAGWLEWVAVQGQIDPSEMQRVEMTAKDWIEGSLKSPINFCQFEFIQGARSQKPKENWIKTWRWPLGLAAGLVLLHIVGLQTQWAILRSEKSALVDEMAQTFKEAFPQISVVVDPLVQMRRGIVELTGKQVGGANSKDMIAMLARLGNAVNKLNSGTDPMIESFEYRNEVLTVTFAKEPSNEQLQSSLTQEGLSGSPAAVQAGNKSVWQIRWGS